MDIVGQYLNNSLKWMAVTLFLLSGITTVLNFNGYSIFADSFVMKAVLSIFAIGAGLYMWAGWKMILYAVPRADTPVKIGLSWAATFIFAASLIPLSSAPNVIALSGNDPHIIHMERTTRDFQSAITQSLSLAGSLEGIAEELNQAAIQYDLSAKAELLRGEYTRRPGPGAVVDAFNSVSEDLKNSAEALRTRAVAMRQGADNAQTQLGLVRQAMDAPGELKLKTQSFESEASTLSMILSDIDVRPSTELLQRLAIRMPDIMAGHSRLSANPATARLQQEAIARVEAEISRTAESLLQANIRLQNEAVEIPTTERLSSMKAVMVYWNELLFFWVGGIALDLAPLIFLSFLSLIMTDYRDKNGMDAMLSGMTAAHMLRAMRVMRALEIDDCDDEDAARLRDYMLGRGRQAPRKIRRSARRQSRKRV